jgi:hypothetical protein
VEDISGLPDFFEAFPEAEAIECFRHLKTKRENASAILYYIKFMHDPMYEHLRLMKPEDRSEELKRWLGIEAKELKNSTGGTYQYIAKCEQWYINHWLDPTAQLLSAHTQKIFDSQKVVRDFQVDSFEAMGIYEKGISTFESIKTIYDKAVQSFKSQTGQKAKHGGGTVGAADTDELFEVD